MIYLTPDDRRKVELLDKLFSALSAEDIARMVECDLIVGKLKGVPISSGSGKLSQMFDEFSLVQGETTSLRSEVMSFKADFQCLLRILNKGMGDYAVASEFGALKNRHNIY